MIITRTPFRITLGGGGTDLPEYYEKNGGFVLATAIDKYMYVAVNRPKTDDLIHIKSRNSSESVATLDEVKHDLAREVLRYKGIYSNIDISSVSDIDAGTGLGSSSCYVVGLLNALGGGELAETDYTIERNILNRPIGKQDPYMAERGGFRVLSIGQDGDLLITKLTLLPPTLRKLEKNLLLYFTGITRSADSILREQAGKPDYDAIMKIGIETTRAIVGEDLDRVGYLFDEHWEVKKGTASGVTNEHIDFMYRYGKENGATGGKVSGAGGGGFMLYYVPKDHKKFRQAMFAGGFKEMPFKFEKGGSKVIYHD